MTSNVSLQVIPHVAGDTEEAVYGVVDRVIDYIRSTGLPFEVGPMETTIEGELSRLLDIVGEAQRICVEHGAHRVLSVVKIDYRPGGITMAEKPARHRNG
ncbi:MAG: thiamine-binding protein [Spirochaetales bacterium]|nr:thiamine-binding protein [Spirochaetales bacterium]